MHTAKQDTYYVPQNPFLAQLVEQAKAAYPTAEDSARIHRGAALVERGDVTFAEDGTCTVTSNCHAYPVNGHCVCPDAHKPEVQGRCKHLYAKTLAKRLAQAKVDAALNSRQFYASLCREPGQPQLHGVVTAWRDGRVFFQEHDSSENTLLTDYQYMYLVVMGGQKDFVDAAKAEADEAAARDAAYCPGDDTKRLNA